MKLISSIMTKKRLSKTIAAAGVASRRACETLIFEGRVKVNGQPVLLPQTLVGEEDVILVDEQPIAQAEKKQYYLLHKPAGYICSAMRNGKSKIVLDLFADVKARLFTVGRLDKDTEGLLIVTNDGHFAHRVMHPSSNIQKEYLVKTDQEITADHLCAIAAGTQVEGTFVKPIRVSKVRKGTLKIVVGEGKKREVRHLCQTAGLRIEQLTRIRIGGLQLGPIPLGSWRPMTEKEKGAIFA
jgi:23S rRNA pseudouridine2605 synthase